MKQFILTFLLCILISHVFGQASPSMTPMSLSSSVSISMSMTMSLSSSVSISMSMTMMSHSSTVSISLSRSVSPSYTITPSTSIIRYFAPIDLMNTCMKEKQFACISWTRTVVGVTYDTFNLRYGLADSSYKTTLNGIKSNQYVLTGLQPGSDYSVYVQGVTGTHISPWSAPMFFTTQPDFREGVNNIMCWITSQRTVVCNWDNGKNLYSLIRASLYCPDTSTTKISKMGVRDGQTTTTLTGVPKSATVCKVEFRVKYTNFSTQKTIVKAWKME
jgi:hypothetical protein